MRASRVVLGRPDSIGAFSALGKSLGIRHAKYGNVHTKIDGITFSSKKEAQYYLLLKSEKKSGRVRSFRLQPRYELQPAFEKNGVRHRKIEYVADFEVIERDGKIKVIDTKGVRTEVFNLKQKLFEHRYPKLTIEVV